MLALRSQLPQSQRHSRHASIELLSLTTPRQPSKSASTEWTSACQPSGISSCHQVAWLLRIFMWPGRCVVELRGGWSRSSGMSWYSRACRGTSTASLTTCSRLQECLHSIRNSQRRCIRKRALLLTQSPRSRALQTHLKPRRVGARRDDFLVSQRAFSVSEIVA